MQNVLSLLGRIFIAAVFLFSGFRHLLDIEGTAGQLASHGMSYSEALTFLFIILELFGAISLILGYRTSWGAALLGIYVVFSMVVFNPRIETEAGIVEFSRDLAILGGVLYVWAFGPGQWSMNKGGKSKARRKEE